METWKTIIKYPRYEVSNFGRVRNIKSGRVKTNSVSKSGYYFVNLYKDNMNMPDVIPVHRAVAWEFVPGDKNLTVNHKNGIKTDNTASNLEWVTLSSNVRHAWTTGLTPTLRGESCGKSILNDSKVREIRYRLSKGDTQTEVARYFGITQANVSAIFKRITWKHI